MSASSSHRGHSSRHRPDGPSSSQASSSRRRLPPLPPTRYAGDGLDFRRPVMSSNEQEAVIDLTNEPDSSPPRTRQQRSPNRPPRFGRDILSEHEVVDLVDEPDYSENRDPPSSPEVQVVGATTRPRLPPPPPQPRAPSLNRTTFFNLLRSADLWPTPLLDFGALDTVFLGQSGRPVDDPTLNLNEPGPSRGPQRSAYKPPSPPPEGFTRTAGEEDIVVCPNCESELGIGSDQKQEVWIAKQCGHVRISILYCPSAVTDMYRPTVANARETGLFRSLRNQCKKRNPSRNAKCRTVGNLLVHRNPWFRCICRPESLLGSLSDCMLGVAADLSCFGGFRFDTRAVLT